MLPRRHRLAFTVTELLVVVAVIVLLMGLLLPAASKVRNNARISVSKSNLRQLGIAHKIYAADWADRHVTYTRDNLGLAGGDVRDYSDLIYGTAGVFESHPPILAGWGYNQVGNYVAWAYWPLGNNRPMFQPMNFPGPPYELAQATGWGWFRFGIQATAFNSYVNHRCQEPIFYAPNDRWIYDRVQRCFDVPGEFVAYPRPCNPAWASYGMSPAGLFSPQVFGRDGEGRFWNAPWEMPAGYRVPSFGQVAHPSLKTHMLEHHWLQNAKMTCNLSFLGCSPYFFNQAFRSKPATLFYDGSVRLMAVTEAMSADVRQLRQAGHGLWSRDTPFGNDGYFISDGFDFAATSFHMLTVDGVRGRDTIAAE